MQSTAADPLVGYLLEGRYRILQRLAVGGMSTVYAAVDERLEREVAVKVMARTLSADPVFVDRFAREARAAAKLSHVNAVSVYDQGSDAGNVFLVMELVRGRTLRDLIRERGILSPAEAVSLMEPVLAALAAAHRAGLAHRDVKPENILLSDDGVVKVADFGLARAVESNAASTRTGLMMGTVAYSSPEQFRGSNADIRSDVYSAGIVLFELLTGRPPYQGADAMAVAYQHVHNDVPAPSSLQRGISFPIDRLLRRVTARDPAHRPPDAGAFLAELHDVRRELRLPVMPVPRRPRGAPPNRIGAPARPRGASDALRTPAPDVRTSADAHTARTAPDPRPVLGAHPTMVGPTGQAGMSKPKISKRGGDDPAPKRGATRQRKPHRLLRTIVGALVLLLVCAALIAGSWWWASARYSSIADVRDQSVSAATAALRDQGFTVVQDDPVPSETVPKGQIVSTDPPGGNRLVRGRTVHVVVSAGPTYFSLPELRSQTNAFARQALAALQQGGVAVTYSQTADDTVSQGAVVSTSPVGGAKVKRGDSVLVVISTGPPILSVPGVVGKRQPDATKTLTAAGFKVATTQAFSDDVDKGTVISQNPAASSQQRKFSMITLTVSKGPDLVEVPKLRNLDPAEDARQRLEDLGFVVELRSTFGGTNGLVVGIEPGSGKKIERGSTVTLYVV